MPLPLRPSETVTRKKNDAETSLHLPRPLSPSIPSILSNTSIQNSRPSGQSAANTDSPSSSKAKSTIPRHCNNSTSPFTTSIAHIVHPSWSESRNVRRPTSSPSPSSTLSHHFSTPLFSPKGSCFSSQQGASGIDSRSTPIRRQPASRSSHGIETLSGPPPALSTQRSYTAETTRRQPSPADSTVARPHLRPRSKTELSIDAVVKPTRGFADDNLLIEPSETTTKMEQGTTRKEGKMPAITTQYQKPPYFGDDQDQTVRNLESIRSSAEMTVSDDPRQEQSKSLHEDLFLNLARTDALPDEAGNGISKSERRRSRISVLNSRHPHTSLPPSARPQSSGKHIPGHSFSSSQGSASFHWSPSAQPRDFSSPSFTRSPSSKDRLYAASAHPLDRDSQSLLNSNLPVNTSRARSGSNRETSPESPTTHSQRQFIREPSPGLFARAYKQSNLSYSTNGHYTPSAIKKLPDTNMEPQRRPQIHHIADTESTVSTTAPSTIWDDIEDLKQRMRKVELTGKLPSSSAAAISKACGERPPTASTTMTTISSSPKHGRVGSISPETSTVKGPETGQIHPLLHSALARSKPLIGRDIYDTLEATAWDALALAAMTGSVAGLEKWEDSTPASGINRQLRRKADSMCRSLTELCITLTENSEGSRKTQSPHSRRERSISLHQSIEGVQEPLYSRATSEDPGTRSNSRIMARLEARRASMQMSNSSHTQNGSPQNTITSAALATPPGNRPARSSPDRQRHTGEGDNPKNSTRPMSRAATEIAHLRPSPSSWVPHYTSQHPLPSPSQRSPSVQSSLPVRRSRLSLSSQLPPSTPNILPGNRRYPDRTTPPSSTDSARLAEMRQQRLASLKFSSNSGVDRSERGTGGLEAEGPS